MTEQPLELRKRRDFGEVFSDTVTFIKEHFKPLSRATIIIAGPFILLYSIYSGVTQVNIFNFDPLNFRPDLFFINFIAVIILSLVTTIVVSAVGYDYVKLALQYKKDDITPELVWKQVKSDLGRIIKIFIAFGILGAIVAVVFFILFFISPVLMILLIFGVPFLIYAFFKLIFTYNAAIIDEYSTVDSMSYSWNLSSGHFWQTFGLVLIAGLILSVIGGVFYIPAIIIQVLSRLLWAGEMPLLLKSVMIFTNILGQIVSSLAYIIYIVVLCLQYFSIQEDKEGRGLLERINEMGNQQEGNYSSERPY